MKLVQADFNNRDERGRVRLNLAASLRDLEALGADASAGAEVWLTDGEGFVSAVISQEGIWLGEPNWDTWFENRWVDTALTSISEPRRVEVHVPCT